MNLSKAGSASFFSLGADSSVGRAVALHATGQRFEPASVHLPAGRQASLFEK